MSSTTTMTQTKSSFSYGGVNAIHLDRVFNSNSSDVRVHAHKLLHKIVQNIVNNPSEVKFRKINMGKLRDKLVVGSSSFIGMEELLLALGFVRDGAAPDVFNYAATDYALMQEALAEWQRREDVVAQRRADMEKLTRERADEIARSKNDRMQQRDNIKKLNDCCRRDNADKPVTSSVGTNMKFGSVKATLPPPSCGPKGG